MKMPHEIAAANTPPIAPRPPLQIPISAANMITKAHEPVKVRRQDRSAIFDRRRIGSAAISSNSSSCFLNIIVCDVLTRHNFDYMGGCSSRRLLRLLSTAGKRVASLTAKPQVQVQAQEDINACPLKQGFLFFIPGAAFPEAALNVRDTGQLIYTEAPFLSIFGIQTVENGTGEPVEVILVGSPIQGVGPLRFLVAPTKVRVTLVSAGRILVAEIVVHITTAYNARAHWRRASGLRYETETSSRRRVQRDCWAAYMPPSPKR